MMLFCQISLVISGPVIREKVKEALENGVNELKQRVLSAAEFSVQLDSVNSMLDYEAKVYDVIDVREMIIKIVENQERLRLELKTITEEVERLKSRKF